MSPLETSADGTATDVDDHPTPLGSRRPVGSVVMMGVATLAVAAVLLRQGPEPLRSARPGHWLILAVVIVGFGLAEQYAFHIEYRREAISFTMSEVPAALALAFLSPVGGVLIRVVVSVGVIWITLRPPLYKTVFNAGLFSFEMMLAYWLVRTFGDPAGAGGARFLVSCAISLAISTLVGSIIVSIAISRFEGALVKRLTEEFRTNAIATPAISIIATVSVAPTLFSPELVVFALVPIVAAWLLMLKFGQLTQHHRDLQAIHGFAGIVAMPVHLRDVTSIAIDEACRLLRAGRGVLQVYDENGLVVASGEHGDSIDGIPTSRFDDRWGLVFAAQSAVPCRFVVGGHVQVAASGSPVTMIAVPIRDTTDVIGLLVVAERSGASRMFADNEISRAATLSGQLASTLRRALLHTRMEYTALHDGLTGSPNRAGFEIAVDGAFARHRNRMGCTAVLMLDLDRFKEVNDTLGHHVGDRVLVEFASQVTESLTPGDELARFGGDEFAVLVHRPTLADVVELAETIIAGAYAPLRLDDLDVVVTASVGIAEMSRDESDTAELLRRADVAMYTAKRERTRVEVYRKDIDRRTPERLSLLGSLRDVLDRQGLEVHYQPKIDLLTSTVIGAEALVRWNHPGRGWINPIDFIQVAEESGLIKQLTDQVLTTAIRTASGWSAGGFDLGVAVNLSAHDLLDERLATRIGDLLTAHSVPAERLTLEITESALLADTPRTIKTIARLNDLGVRLSLDDFGTGYSSFAYLRQLPAAELKIDRSFVSNLLLDKQDEAIVRSTIDLGHNLGLQVVAEGIENMPVLERLQTFGCDIGQGYGISRPLAPDMFATWLLTTQYKMPKANVAAFG